MKRMRNRKHHLLIIIILLFIGIGATSCRDTNNGGLPNPPEEIEEGWFTTQIMIEADGLSIPTLRALSEEGENGIDQSKVRVLVFDGGKFHYEAKVTKIEPSLTPDDNENKGKITLLAQDSKPGSTGSTIVLLANVDPNTNTTAIAKDTEMEDVMKRFTFDMPANGTWQNGNLPMWGVLETLVNHNSPNSPTPPLGTIHLTRAVARVDVGLNLTSTATGASQFNEVAKGITYRAEDGTEVEVKLTNVYLYNTNKKGRVAPIASDQGIWDATNRKAKAPSLPLLDPPRTVIPPIDRSQQVVDGKLLLRDIYLPEASNDPTTASANGTTLPEADANNYLQRPFMVVGLTGADRSNHDKETFFRIDYLQRSGEEQTATYEYLPLLRNHRYLVNITNVGGPGFDTKEEAKSGPAANIMYDVQAWNESSMSNVQYDGQYMLGVSEDNLTYYNRKETQQITVRTSWKEGWKAAVAEADKSWLTIDKTAGEANADVSLNITVGDNTAPDATIRTGVITITAGRMSWEVKVEQSNEGIVSIKITGHADQEDAGMPIIVRNFTGKAETKKITVEYLPTTNVEVLGPEGLSLVEDFKFEKIEEESVPGRAVYKITVKEFTDENNPFESLADVAYFTVKADGKTSAASMVLVQTEYNVIPYKDKALVWDMLGENAFYPMDGSEKKFYVQANTPYEIVMVQSTNSTNTSKNLIKDGFKLNEPLQKSGRYQGEELTFTPINNVDGDNIDPDAYLGFVEFEIRSPKGLFEAKRFKVILGSGIIQEEANCYLLQPGKMGILIPVKRVNTAHLSYKTMLSDVSNSADYTLPTLAETQFWRPFVIWSDMESEGVKPVNIDGTSGIQAIYKWKEGSQGYIFVLPGKDKTGNALIECAVFDEESKKQTLWSWHIWIVNDYPMVEGKRWLDRNLGAITPATTDDDKDILTFGMQYQFGRKDPFPPLTSKGYRPLVNSAGTVFNIKDVYNTHTMKDMMNNPTVMIRNNRHWLKESDYSSYRASGYRRVWHAIWGGDIYEGTDEDINLKTEKSVFDPCPYGWKVPAYGQESKWASSGLTFPKAGFYLDGYVSRYREIEEGALYGLSSVREDNHKARYIAIGVRTDFYGRSTSRVIRCVKNENEPTYESYLPKR